MFEVHATASKHESKRYERIGRTHQTKPTRAKCKRPWTPPIQWDGIPGARNTSNRTIASSSAGAKHRHPSPTTLTPATGREGEEMEAWVKKGQAAATKNLRKRNYYL